MEYHQCNESAKQNRVFAIACLRKKLLFHTEICDYSNKLQLLNFKNRSISSGQGGVQIELNSV